MTLKSEIAAALAWSQSRLQLGTERTLGDALAQGYEELSLAARDLVSALCEGCKMPSSCGTLDYCGKVARLREILGDNEEEPQAELFEPEDIKPIDQDFIF